MKPIGIVVQDISAKPQLELNNINYNGLARYKSFPVLCNHNGVFDSNIRDMINLVVKTDLQSLVSCINSCDGYNQYLSACNKQGIETRSIFLLSDSIAQSWKEEMPIGISLGYEFAYSNYDDPEFIFLLSNEPELSTFKHKLNKHGLFTSKNDAEEFGQLLYSTFPFLEEEMPYNETFVFELIELSN